MRDWKAIAKASGISGSENELDALAAPLQGLEQVMRPLMQELTPDLDPATGFDAEEDGAE